MAGTRYKVFIAPLENDDSYADEIDVTDKIQFDGIANISMGIDSGDYNFGVYTLDDVQLVGLNDDGYFNDPMDIRSIFRHSRDLAKVRIQFINPEDEETIVYRGLINDEASRVNATGDTVNFRVLSYDSVFRKLDVSSGLVQDGMTASQAIYAILNRVKITNLLTVDSSNINPDNDFTIDVGSEFDLQTTRDALNQILLASNSVFLIDADLNVIVRSRVENTDKAILNLYGPNDIKRRQNIITLTAYNTGLHRMFTDVEVNGQEASLDNYIEAFGFRKKKLTFDFITDDDTALSVADSLMNEFKTPKIELNLEVPIRFCRDVELLDRVSVNWPLRIKPFEDSFLPIVGQAVIDDDETPLPYQFGSLKIDANVGFKVINITENPTQFYRILKLRQIGDSIDDGYLNGPSNCIVGFSVIGSGVICSGGDPCDTYNPAYIGGAKLGCTRIA